MNLQLYEAVILDHNVQKADKSEFDISAKAKILLHSKNGPRLTMHTTCY